jgi:hypothetical protein
VRFSKLHLEHPDKDVNFFGPVKALPQLQGLPVVLLIQSKQLRGQVHHGRAIFLHVSTQQSLYTSLHTHGFLSKGGKNRMGV